MGRGNARGSDEGRSRGIHFLFGIINGLQLSVVVLLVLWRAIKGVRHRGAEARRPATGIK